MTDDIKRTRIINFQGMGIDEGFAKVLWYARYDTHRDKWVPWEQLSESARNIEIRIAKEGLIFIRQFGWIYRNLIGDNR
jgi:hypothetical protein